MLNKLKQIFQSNNSQKSSNIAKKRLQLVLIQDRIGLSQGALENLKDDLIKVISNHLTLEHEDLEINLEQEEESVALMANIPVEQIVKRK